MPEPHNHAKNLTGTLPIKLGAKSLRLRLYDVLMNDTGKIQRQEHYSMRYMYGRTGAIRGFGMAIHPELAPDHFVIIIGQRVDLIGPLDDKLNNKTNTMGQEKPK